MIDKIKGVLSVRGEVDELKRDMSELSLELRKLTEDYKTESVRMKELHDTQSDLLSTFLSATQTLNKLKEDIRAELEEFRMFNRQVQSKIMDKFNQEISTVLTTNTKALELDKSHYEKMRHEIEKHGELLSQINVEMGKMVLISQRIKSQDFELSEHHKKLLESDQNKLHLMQRVDELERMIAKFKQSPRPGRQY
ncbi:MAG: hypothetical protein AABX47_09385 [Nanoarchaeota archaeon]